MLTINLYKYNREGGGVTVSPVKPNKEYFEMFRLVADEGKALTKDGVELYPCTDAESIEGWYEVDAPNDEDYSGDATEADYLAALERFGVE